MVRRHKLLSSSTPHNANVSWQTSWMLTISLGTIFMSFLFLPGYWLLADTLMVCWCRFRRENVIFNWAQHYLRMCLCPRVQFIINGSVWKWSSIYCDPFCSHWLIPVSSCSSAAIWFKYCTCNTSKCTGSCSNRTKWSQSSRERASKTSFFFCDWSQIIKS